MNSDSIEELEAKHMQRRFEIAVVFTTVQNTLESLQVADRLTTDLSARITLLVREGGKSASTITPIMLADFTSRYFLTLLPHTGNLKIRITQYRASLGDFWDVLSPGSIVVIAGATNRFWPSAEQRFARRLRQAGHEVILLSTCSQFSL